MDTDCDNGRCQALSASAGHLREGTGETAHGHRTVLSLRRVLLVTGALLAAGAALLAVLWLLGGEPRPIGSGYDIGADKGFRTCWVRLNDEPTDYTTVQAAVDASNQATDVVKVAGYCTGVQARQSITQVLYISKTVTVRGGYTTTNWHVPDPLANPTTLDAQGLGRVLVITGTITPTVEGLRLTGGNATGLGGGSFYDAGGGVYVYTATATISGCVVHSNTASTASYGYGGGLALFYSDATLRGNTVQGNTASTDRGAWGIGGGVHLYASAAILEGNTVVGNTGSTVGTGIGGGLHLWGDTSRLEYNTVQSNTGSTAGRGDGGGLALSDSAATLKGNTVISNTGSTAAMGRGGGLYLSESAATLERNTVQGNAASTASEGYGGGLGLYWSNATLQRNAVVSNTATYCHNTTGRGGGLWVYGSNPFILTNGLVAGNHANAAGSGLWVEGPSHASASGRLLHTTIADNGSTELFAGQDGGQGVHVGPHAALALTNTIIAGHAGQGITITAGSTVTLEATLWYSNGTDTGGAGTILTDTVNVYGDPAFVNPAAGDYHLGEGSAALDAGVDAGVTADMDGDPRPQGTGYDIGADEFGSRTFPIHLPLVLRDD
jgi:hypothetical protein